LRYAQDLVRQIMIEKVRVVMIFAHSRIRPPNYDLDISRTGVEADMRNLR
jgi:hypothetical protein